MKISKKKEKANAASTAKPQKTLFDFFQKPGTSSTQVEKVLCPACNTHVVKSKINWHLDQDCKSKEKKGAKKGKRSAVTEKKVTKDGKDKKKRKKAMLSDSEDEEEEDGIEILEPKKEEEGENSSDDFFINASMVEVMMDEESDNGNAKTTPVKVQSAGEAVSPYFSSSAPPSNITPGKRKEKVIVNQIPKIEINSISLLQADWDSPEPTPEKTEHPSASKPRQPTPCSSEKISPLTVAAKVVKKMLEEDWDLSSPQTTPSKDTKGVKVQSNGKHTPKSIGYPERNSDEEFEEEVIVFRTPNKPKPKNSTKKSSKKSPAKANKDSVADVDKSMLTADRSSNALRSPASSQGSTALESEGDSIPLFSPIRSPGLVSPTRSPTPSPDCKSLNPVIRKLFTPPVSPQHSPASSPEVSPSKLKLSPQINNNVHRFNRINKVLSSQEDAFNALSQSTLQNSQSPTKSPEKGKLLVRTPRKINQSIRSSGLLQNSSQCSLNVITPRNKKRHSPSASNENSPMKESPGTSSQDDGNRDQEKTLAFDPAMYRDRKGYYLDNFMRILDTVVSQPQDLQLLNCEDLSVIETFRKLSLSAQKLYVRLFQRKIKWNKASKIDYKDICDAEDTILYIKELTYANFLLNETEMTGLEEVLAILSSEELHGLCKQMKVRTNGKKEELVSTLIKFTKQQKSIFSAFKKTANEDPLVLKRAKAILGHCCLVNKEVRRVFMRVLMLYGLPRYDEEEEGGQQSQLTTLLMVNMGKMEFPEFEVIRNHSIFRTREDLLRYETCNQILIDVQECMEAQKWEEALQHCQLAVTTYQELISDEELMNHEKGLPSFLRRFTSVSVLIYILTCSVECHQRLKSYQKAVDQLQDLLKQRTHLQDYRGRWFDRLALNLATHLKKPAQAVDAIQQALKDPEVRKGHRLSLSMRAQKMAASARHKSLAATIAEMPLMHPREAPKVIIEGRSLPGDIPGYKRAFIRQDSARHAGEGEVTVCSVEELVLGHYKDQGYTEGLHREGTTVNSLFGLYFWDALYSPVSDVFRSPHQASPLDLDDPNFYAARKEWIDQRLSDMRHWPEERAFSELEQIWTQHLGKVSLVAWDLFRNIDHAKSFVASMGTSVLAAICERLAKDHRFTRSGFPDLVVWDPLNKKCRIVEVKGPNDRLSTKQILWLEYLLDNGAVAEVCHVEAIGAKKMRKASPRKISPKKASPRKVSPKESPPKSRKGGKRSHCDNGEEEEGGSKENKTQAKRRRKAPKSKPSERGRKGKLQEKVDDSDDFEEPAVKIRTVKS
ncbi:LOW QUALITY PROTEIN: fanconi-associated nuclease 1-like [Penaeus chinensis]|uniref:LOW QUALITY PROTEIN: fanconi-associated nuclease 1-like n=1 Tax=Penaeus chinensis TaxID=139456 RepID=UPI001FB5D580|nr:LOW QUALITY PROTEIN: fanconi-associated nuclease 1-like [Penaeus chinensis]